MTTSSTNKERCWCYLPLHIAHPLYLEIYNVCAVLLEVYRCVGYYILILGQHTDIIQNLQTYKNYHLLISTKSSLGKILQGKCFAAPIISHHLNDSFSIQWTKLFVAFVMTVLLFFSIQSFLRNWMEFEFHVVLCCKCQNLNVSHIKTVLPNTILQQVH